MDFGVANRPFGGETNKGNEQRFRPDERLRCVKRTGSYPRGVSRKFLKRS
jgi:hypothetical protein